MGHVGGVDETKNSRLAQAQKESGGYTVASLTVRIFKQEQTDRRDVQFKEDSGFFELVITLTVGSTVHGPFVVSITSIHGQQPGRAYELPLGVAALPL
jgi:hypothetical protein